MTEKDLGRFEMLWDCEACGTEKLLGLSHRHCPSCGSAQDPQRRYFPPEGEEIAVGAHPYVGADRRCPACDSPMARAAEHCGNCGSAMDEAAEVAVRQTQTAGPSGFAADSVKAARAERKAPTPTAPPKKSAAGKIVLAIVAAVILLVVVFSWKKEVEVEVVGHRWARSIEVERFGPVERQAWRNEVPPGARVRGCSREVRDHEQVEDGQTCTQKRQDLGDGTFKTVEECRPKYRKEPIHDDRCRYEIDAWTTARRADARGEDRRDVAWPAPSLARTGNCVGCEREGARAERYELIVDRAGERADCAVAEATWRGLEPGARIAVKSGVLSGRLDCDSLVPR